MVTFGWVKNGKEGRGEGYYANILFLDLGNDSLADSICINSHSIYILRICTHFCVIIILPLKVFKIALKRERLKTKAQ